MAEAPFRVVAAQAVTGGVVVSAAGVVAADTSKGAAIEGDASKGESIEAETSIGNSIEGQGFTERC